MVTWFNYTRLHVSRSEEKQSSNIFSCFEFFVEWWVVSLDNFFSAFQGLPPSHPRPLDRAASCVTQLEREQYEYSKCYVSPYLSFDSYGRCAKVCGSDQRLSTAPPRWPDQGPVPGEDTSQLQLSARSHTERGAATQYTLHQVTFIGHGDRNDLINCNVSDLRRSELPAIKPSQGFTSNAFH